MIEGNLKYLDEKLFTFIAAQLTDELVRQGHKLTGSLILSLDSRFKEFKRKDRVEFLMKKYGLYLNYGVEPDKIPYTEGEPRAKKSKYIQGLIEFAIKKFSLDKKAATSVAFAIAKKQKKKGSPLSGKIGFFDIVLEKDSDKITEIISDYYEATIELMIHEYLTFR